MFTQLNAENYKDTVSATRAGLCLCFKKLCPHCKNMEKVLEKFSQMQPDASLFSLDMVEEEQIAHSMQVERAPTLLFIHGGIVVDKKVGLMNPRELLTAFLGAQ